MQYFSLVQSAQIPDTGEKGKALSTIFQEILYSTFFFFKLQMWLLRAVWLASGSLNEFLWTPSLALKVVEASPMKFSSVPFPSNIVVWYTKFFARHLFCRGQSALLLQLHPSSSTFCLFKILAFLLDIIASKLGVQLQLTLTEFRLKILCRGFSLGKLSSINFRNPAAMLVLTVALNGGLNQTMFLFLDFFFLDGSLAFGSYSS